MSIGLVCSLLLNMVEDIQEDSDDSHWHRFEIAISFFVVCTLPKITSFSSSSYASAAFSNPISFPILLNLSIACLYRDHLLRGIFKSLLVDEFQTWKEVSTSVRAPRLDCLLVWHSLEEPKQ